MGGKVYGVRGRRERGRKKGRGKKFMGASPPPMFFPRTAPASEGRPHHAKYVAWAVFVHFYIPPSYSL